jgi:hypothetical protein
MTNIVSMYILGWISRVMAGFTRPGRLCAIMAARQIPLAGGKLSGGPKQGGKAAPAAGALVL